ncbi:hypothetical protein [Chondromyces apiculatus]|uniref:Extensin-like protein n=1 Tax=Chondromyces apiculatus DSM 436 TaxID=1192034 RepID=A0A017STY3_9BACT|nr:hypothetical protein [Chondromyces apiculatus]EYF00448.1 Extensin-like protein precursor [Chondromyces apiculatus DSM 436]
MLTREASFLIAAGVLHVAIPVMAHLAPEPARVMVAQSSGASEEILVEMDPEAILRQVPRARTVETPEEVARAEMREQDPLRRRMLQERVPSSEAPTEMPPEGAPEGVPPEGPAEVPPVPTAAPSATDDYGGPPSPEVAVAPGLGGVPVWQVPGVLPDHKPAGPAPTVAPARPDTPTDKAGQLLREAMRTKDKALGLDLPAAGTVASAVVEAARAGDTPMKARATFEVRLSGSGQVLGARLVSSNAGSPDVWAQVAQAAKSRLSGRALVMPSTFAKGAVVYVSIVSSVRMPSGSEGGVNLQGAGFGFDVSDVGAHASRVISSSFKVVAVE